MISVLVPSRQRPDLLARSIESLGDGDIEALVRVDEDDPRLEDYLALPDVEVVVGPHHGYAALQHYYNELAHRARGDWLFLWNDDCLMQGDDWRDKDGCIARNSNAEPRRRGHPMQLIGSSLGTLVVAMIYYAYRDRAVGLVQHHRMLRERVTYMLWVMASHVS